MKERQYERINTSVVKKGKNEEERKGVGEKIERNEEEEEEDLMTKNINIDEENIENDEKKREYREKILLF